MNLLLDALVKFICGLLAVGGLIFIPAGTFEYPNGWLFIGLLFCPMLVLGVVLLLKSPDLLKKRLEYKEKESVQKSVVALSGGLFLLGFILAGLDYRFSWSCVPTWTVIIAAVILILAYALYAEVMRENAYLSRTIKVEHGQKVIDTGLYGIVRHPMYMSTVLLFLTIPMVLGSWYALIPFACYPIIIVVRIINEEKVLENELEGYSEYKKKAKYRLVTFVW